MNTERSREGEAATQVILAVFRANGVFLAAGDRLSADEGLTSARWQVLGAVALAGGPLTVPQIARRMGLTRQSVHSSVGRLVADGMLELAPNADHQRSQLVLLTNEGRARYEALDRLQASWVSRLTSGIDEASLETAARVLEHLSSAAESLNLPDDSKTEATALNFQPSAGLSQKME